MEAMNVFIQRVVWLLLDGRSQLEPKCNVSRFIMHSNETQFPKPNEKSLYVTAL